MAVTIEQGARIDCDDFTAGDGTIIRAGAHIYGKSVHLGRECFIDEHAVIGGGSADDGCLFAGDWLHMGMYSQINTARKVIIGTEVGLGIGTRVFTHGAYLSELDGFPVSFADVHIGNRVWLPNAQVNPGAIIGSDVVVAAGSVVSGKIPPHCLAGGTPAKVIRADCYPATLPATKEAEILERVAFEAGVVWPPGVFHIRTRTITGEPTEDNERLRNQLRRHGIRFPFSVIDGEYVQWT